MTRDKFLAKYGTEKVIFHHYYKYTFVYTGTAADGKTLSVHVGGNHDDIYRFEVVSSREELIQDLDIYAGYVFVGGELEDHFYDY